MDLSGSITHQHIAMGNFSSQKCLNCYSINFQLMHHNSFLVSQQSGMDNDVAIGVLYSDVHIDKQL